MLVVRMSDVQSREEDVLHSMSQMEQQQMLWDDERHKLQLMAREGQDSVFDESQTYAESQVAQLTVMQRTNCCSLFVDWR